MWLSPSLTLLFEIILRYQINEGIHINLTIYPILIVNFWEDTKNLNKAHNYLFQIYHSSSIGIAAT